MTNIFEKIFNRPLSEKEQTGEIEKPKILKIEKIGDSLRMEVIVPKIGKRLILDMNKVRRGDFEAWKKYGRGMAVITEKKFEEIKSTLKSEAEAYIGGHFREIEDEKLKGRDIEERLKKGELISEEGEKYREGTSEDLSQDVVIKESKTGEILGKIVRKIEGPRRGGARLEIPIVLENLEIPKVGKIKKFDGWIGKIIKESEGEKPSRHPVGHTYFEGKLEK